MRILIVEDEEKLASSLKHGLEKQGYSADYITDGDKAETRIHTHRNDYDIIVLDLMLPGKNGVDICRSAREENIKTPILVLTARTAIEDKVNVLDIGADDYMVKPFSFSEFTARIRALLRRPDEALPVKLSAGQITLDTATRKVHLRNKELTLTLKEFSLLEYFMRHPNQVLNREQILDHAWDFAFDSFSNVVDVHIKNLRHKLGDEKGKHIIETVDGLGYRFKEQMES